MDIHSLIASIEEYADAAGKAPGTVCREATGNFRLYDRLKRRAALTEVDSERLLAFMASNPVTPDASCLEPKHTDSGMKKQGAAQ